MSCITIDWLQISCVIDNEIILDAETSKTGAFKIVKRDIRHNVFSKHIEIHGNLSGIFEPVAVFSYAAISSILPKNIGHLKIINKYLYCGELNRLVDTILRELELKWKSVSRLDIALDFLRFNKKMSVQQFFKRVASGQYLKEKACSLHIDGKTTRNLDIHYMRFGSKTSGLQFYVYNKSKELREVKNKPYIVDKWCVSEMSPEKNDIYRLEFVIHPTQYSLIDKETGEAYNFDFNNVTNDEFIEQLFWSLFEQHFSFVKNDGQKRKDRMKKVVFFPAKKEIKKIYLRVTEKQTSNRMDKVLIKKLEQLNRAWRNSGGDAPLLKDVLEMYVEVKDLKYWYENIMSINENNSSPVNQFTNVV